MPWREAGAVVSAPILRPFFGSKTTPLLQAAFGEYSILLSGIVETNITETSKTLVVLDEQISTEKKWICLD